MLMVGTGEISITLLCTTVQMRKGEPMIRVNDDWVIEVDDHNYTLKKDLHRTELSRDKKKMVPAYAVKSYHPSLRRALERLHE